MVFWIVRINNYKEFTTLNQRNIWVYDSSNIWNSNKFTQNVKNGDFIWFVEAKTQGNILGVATFKDFSPLSKETKSISLPTELKKVDTEINYRRFFNLMDLELQIRVRFARDFFKVDKIKHAEVQSYLSKELALIKRYATLKRKMI